MDKRQTEVLVRLIFGFVLNCVLWVVFSGFGKSFGAVERDIRLHFIGGCLAATTWVVVVPIFWQGKAWQVPLAFVLVFFLPGLAVLSVITTIVKYW